LTVDDGGVLRVQGVRTIVRPTRPKAAPLENRGTTPMRPRAAWNARVSEDIPLDPRPTSRRCLRPQGGRRRLARFHYRTEASYSPRWRTRSFKGLGPRSNASRNLRSK